MAKNRRFDDFDEDEFLEDRKQKQRQRNRKTERRMNRAMKKLNVEEIMDLEDEF